MLVDNIQFEGQKHAAEANYQADRGTTLIVVYRGSVTPSNRISDIETRAAVDDPCEVRKMVLAFLAGAKAGK